MSLRFALGIFGVLHMSVNAQCSSYQSCPLLGPFVPAPRIDSGSTAVKSVAGSLDKLLDNYIAKADGLFGPITPNTTSFSITLFAGSSYVAGNDDQPFFYEYHHTASDLEETHLDQHSKFPLGDLTQLFAVYTQLVEMGDHVWGDRITRYVPELRNLFGHAKDAISGVQWNAVTLGALAGHMSGTARTCMTLPLSGVLVPKLTFDQPTHATSTSVVIETLFCLHLSTSFQ